MASCFKQGFKQKLKRKGRNYRHIVQITAQKLPTHYVLNFNVTEQLKVWLNHNSQQYLSQHLHCVYSYYYLFHIPSVLCQC